MKPHSFESRIQELLDGTLDSEDRSLLIEELEQSPGVRAIYLEFVHLQVALETNAKAPPCIATDVISMNRVLDRQKRRAMKTAGICAAAILVIAGIIGLFVVVPKPPVGTVIAAPGSQFLIMAGQGDDEKYGKTNELAIGSRIILDTGTLEIKLPSGVRGIVRAPAEFELTSEDLIEMTEGTGWFEVPTKATGFKVRTPEFLVTDLGTEFGIISIPGAPDEVHVFRGLVEVQHLGNRDAKSNFRLTSMEARRTLGQNNWDHIKVDGEAFLQKLPTDFPPETPPLFHWGFDDENLIVEGTSTSIARPTTSALPPGSEPKIVPGRVGKAISLNGDKEFIKTDWFGIGDANPRCVAFWLRLRKNGDRPETSPLIVWGAKSHDPGLTNSKFEILALRDGPFPGSRIQVRFGLSIIQAEKKISSNSWHHIAIVYTGEVDGNGNPEAKIFIDGGECDLTHELFTSQNLESPPPITTQINPALAIPLTIGPGHGQRFGDQSKFWAEFDELYIFDGILPVGEIRKLAHRSTLKPNEKK